MIKGNKNKDKEREFDIDELVKRVASGVMLGGLALAVSIWGGFPFTLFVAIFVLLGSIEIYNLLEMKGETPYREVGILISCLLPFAAYFFHPEILFGLLSFSIIAIFMVQIISREYKGAIEKVLMTFFGIVYIGWLGGAHAIMLRNISREVGEQNFAKIETGLFFFIFTVASTVAGDIGAYFAGKKFGKIKIAEKISPGKTLEGFIGGLAFGVAIAVILRLIFAPKGGIFTYAVLGAVIVLVGLIGDLAESALKRDVHIKDSGFLIPGHGGVLDRVDSVIFSVPTVYYISKYLIRTL